MRNLINAKSPFREQLITFPALCHMNLPRHGSTIISSASSNSSSSWSASKHRFSFNVRLITCESNTIVTSLPSMVMLNTGLLLFTSNKLLLKLTTTTLPLYIFNFTTIGAAVFYMMMSCSLWLLSISDRNSSTHFRVSANSMRQTFHF